MLAQPTACCSANLAPGCPRNATIDAAVRSKSPACATAWSATCVDWTKSLFPAWCPVPPIDCQATCDLIGPDGDVCFWEACDDGNLLNSDNCTNVCEWNVCGDGFVRLGYEQCDDGNAVSTDACTNACQNARCGDGIVYAGVEPCDDGNLINTDDCLTSCVMPSCGDGFLHANSSEQCDPGVFSDTGPCRPGCVLARCGDGFVLAGGEECDSGSFNSDSQPNACRTTCRRPYCGDGVTDSSNAEECDVPGSSCCLGCQFATASCSFCVNATHGSTGTCISGSCLSPLVESCTPYACDPSSLVCLKQCGVNANCAPGFICSGSNCVREEVGQVANLARKRLAVMLAGQWAFLVAGVLLLAALLTVLAIITAVRWWREREWQRLHGSHVALEKLSSVSSSSSSAASSYDEHTATRWS